MLELQHRLKHCSDYGASIITYTILGGVPYHSFCIYFLPQNPILLVKAPILLMKAAMLFYEGSIWQVGPCRGIEMGDHLTMARSGLNRASFFIS